MKKKVNKKPKPRGYWTKERVLTQAKKYKTYHNWKKKCSGSCRIAQKMGWIVEARTLLKRVVRKPITKQEVFAEAKKYQRRVDFQKKSPSHYTNALNHRWLDKCCKHMMSARDSFHQSRKARWDREAILEESKKFENYYEFIHSHPGIYSAILSLKMGNELKKNMKCIRNIKWTYDKLKQEALKYKTRYEFNKHNAGALRKIYKDNLEDDLLSHMKTRLEQARWQKDKVLEAILECKTRAALRQKYPGAYSAMKLHNFNFDHLFIRKICNIEVETLHPQIKNIFLKYKKEFLYEHKFVKKKKSVVPDFVYQTEHEVYIIEAKTSGCYRTYPKKELEDQVQLQKKHIRPFFKDKKVIHVVLSEKGLIKSKKTNINMSLKELSFLLRTGKYKHMPIKTDKGSHWRLAIKIRAEFMKKFFTPFHQKI